ncbi:YegP family protein [Amycolatopsis sp. NPDC051071]|uniref:YegP family protein n=1 Tax=Amycolatopsis sp. NPDC051071 TaxID=3154637 RepID=UPI0034492838
MYTDPAGKFRSQLKAANGEVVAVGSEAYEAKSGALKGIDSVKRNAAEAGIDDLTQG